MTPHVIGSGRSRERTGTLAFLECVDCILGNGPDSQYYVYGKESDRRSGLRLTCKHALGRVFRDGDRLHLHQFLGNLR